MAVELADSDPASKKPLTPAHKVYKDLGMSLKEFKARAAEVGITIKAAISKLSEDQISTICKHLGIPDPVAPSSAIAEAEAGEGEPARIGPSDEALEAARKLEEEETRKLEEEAARKLEEETARTQQLASVAGWLGVKPEQVDTVSQVLGISVPENESDVDDGLKARLTPLYAVIKIAEELDLSSREVFTTARSIGIEVGRKAFKGLTPNEEFMLRAMVKQKHKSREERQAEVTVDSGPEYKPAPPTGNKAVAEAPKREARRAKGGAAPAKVAALPRTAAVSTGISVGISSTGSKTSRKRLRMDIAESSVPTLQMLMLARAAISADPATPAHRSMRKNSANTNAVIACTTLISTQVAAALPRKIQPRVPGARASAVMASFSSSMAKVRPSPITAAKT